MDRNALYYLFGLVRLLLYPLALLYGAVIWLRNRLYDSGFFSSITFSVPVIVVGNLSVGGTGKTPHVEYLIRLLRSQYQLATMSRGYKRHTQGFLLADADTNALRIGDEPMQYHLHFPDVAVSVAEERMTGIPALLQRRPDVQVVLLDDAFQHRSVKPGLAILITDYARPYDTDFILPYGRLRESRSAARRAHIIVVSKCPPQLSLPEAVALRQRLAPGPGQQVFFTAIRYGAAYDLLTAAPVALENKSLLLVAGIARPEPLLTHLNGLTRHVHSLTYADHHYFTTADLEEVERTLQNWPVADKQIVTTEKDAARLLLHRDRLEAEGWRIAVLPIEVYFLFEEGNRFDARVLQYVTPAVQEHEAVYLPHPEPPAGNDETSFPTMSS